MAENVGKRGQSWFYRLDLPASADGRRRQKRVGGFRTEREAKDALAKARVAVARGEMRYTPTRTVADLADEWLGVVQPNRKASTVSDYKLLLDLYVVPRSARRRWDV